MSDLKKYLQDMEDAIRSLGHHPDGFRFNSVQGCVAAQGIECIPGPRPEWIAQGESGLCFMNAWHAVETCGDWRYCEGFALSKSGYPIQHAWAIDEERAVIDPTWTDGAAYYGIPFTDEFVRELLLKHRVWGVFSDFAMEELLRTGIPDVAISSFALA